MGKNLRIFSYVLSIFLAAGIVFMVFNHKPRIAGTTEEFSTAGEAASTLPEKDRTLYDKLRNGEVVRVLIIGDGIAQSDGADSVDNRWYNQLSKRMDRQLNVSLIFKFVTNQQSGAFSSWIDYRSVEKQLQYVDFDLVFICLGQTEESLGLQTFSSLYECLARQIKANNPAAEIIALIESAGQNEFYRREIIKIADYYDMLHLDMKKVFDISGKAKSSLYYYENHPNTAGYALYSQSIFSILKSNMDSGRTPRTDLPEELLNKEALKYTNINILNSFKERKGFSEHLEAYLRNYLYSEKPGDFIEGSFDGSIFGISTISDIDCGYMKIYIDGKQYAEINCYLDFGAKKEILVTNDLEPGRHSFRIEVLAKKDKASLSTRIYLDAVITNEK